MAEVKNMIYETAVHMLQVLVSHLLCYVLNQGNLYVVLLFSNLRDDGVFSK